MEALLDEPTALPHDLPGPLELLRGVAGYALVGAAGLVGGSDGLAASPVALVSGAGMLLLTVPAFLVVHQYMRLRAAPAVLVGEIARVFARCGDLALGLVPAVLLFSVTTSLGGVVLGLALFGMGLLGFSVVIRRLVRAEGASGRAWLTMAVLTLGWAGLTALVGLRIALSFV